MVVSELDLLLQPANTLAIAKDNTDNFLIFIDSSFVFLSYRLGLAIELESNNGLHCNAGTESYVSIKI
ncbi:hypothetical protein VCO01S_35010 [Vibrio comitans NBRC 102076]|uniref:Uncharacterized protein n=1 Tax=Vibrio comitans NBRC 102076 TaxID=1219078 RepID=A0A4Y3IU42_9VIBR|nr:hypothetical protein VCO01S_35010 [Vibrio comitans NBRC 102076]